MECLRITSDNIHSVSHLQRYPVLGCGGCGIYPGTTGHEARIYSECFMQTHPRTHSHPGAIPSGQYSYQYLAEIGGKPTQTWEEHEQ